MKSGLAQNQNKIFANNACVIQFDRDVVCFRECLWLCVCECVKKCERRRHFSLAMLFARYTLQFFEILFCVCHSQ